MTLPSFQKKAFWITIGVLIKVVMCMYFLQQHIDAHPNDGIYAETFATKSYILPIENFITYKRYIENIEMPVSQYIRTPGYGSIYFLFRIFTDESTAKSLLVLLQLVMSGASVYYLSMIGYRLYARPAAFYTVFGLYAASAFVSTYDGYILSESLAVSSLIFSVYFIVEVLTSNAFSKRNIFQLFLAGFWLTLSTFTRPAAAPLFLWFGIGVAVYLWFSANWKKTMLALGCFVCVFALTESLWVIRNYRLSGRFIPFQYNSWYMLLATR